MNSERMIGGLAQNPMKRSRFGCLRGGLGRRLGGVGCVSGRVGQGTRRVGERRLSADLREEDLARCVTFTAAVCREPGAELVRRKT